jgi:hypothetical protein
MQGKLQISVQESVAGGLADVRAEVRASGPFFRVPASPRNITDIVVHSSETSDTAALIVLSGADNPRQLSVHYLVLRDGT